jgi:hypothetical protein
MDLSHDELRRTQSAFKDGKNYTPQTSFVVNQEKNDLARKANQSLANLQNSPRCGVCGGRRNRAIFPL